MQRSDLSGLGGIALCGLVCGLLLWGPAAPILRAAVALPLIFFVPGYLVLRLFLRPSHFKLADILFASGLSVVIVIAGAFLLNAAGLLTPGGWALFLAGVSLLAAAAGKWLGRPVGWPAFKRPAWADFWNTQAIMISAACVLTIAAFLADRHEALRHAEHTFTDFWLVAQDPGRAGELTLGIRNQEGEVADYEVEIVTGGNISGSFRSISLKPGDTWTAPVSGGFKSGRIQRVEAWLFKNKDYGTVYRRVWVDTGQARSGKL
jgi:hypothetical protein